MGPRPKVRFAWARAYVTALPAGLVLLPGAAAVVSISLYLADNSVADGPAQAYGLGAAIGFGVFLLSPLVLRRYAYADRSNPSAYSQLLEFYIGLNARLDCLDDKARDECARAEARAHLQYVGRELGCYEGGVAPFGMRWLLSTGYVDLWRRLHRAEEALILTEAPGAAVGGAIMDDLRLEGSTIASADHLRVALRTAVAALGGDLDAFLKPAPALKERKLEDDTQERHAQARGILRSIRRTINEFRDDRREGIVRARNNLYTAFLFAGIVAYLLLGLAMVPKLEGKRGEALTVSKDVILAGAAFYLVGALVGLFRQLYVASKTRLASEEDYGLTTARLINTPLFSGIAAVAGAALVKILPNGSVDPDKVDLSDVFDLGNWPQGLFWAAVFGLTPTLLFARLQQRADQYREDLKKTEPGEQQADPPR